MIANQAEHKLFFALWPDDLARAALARLQQGLQGRLIPRDKLHLTMAFLGQQPASALPRLRDILCDMVVPPMTLEIDCYGYFKRPRIAWAGMSAPPPALLAVQAELMAKLAAAGFSTTTHGDFKPHITLARDATAAPPIFAGPPLRWEVRTLALVESLTATGSYVPIHQHSCR